MISIEKSFLFVHIPKTGGNAVQGALRKYSEDEISANERQDGVHRFGVQNQQFGTRKHSPLVRYKRRLEPSLFRRLFKFSIMRNPWERAVSLYFSPIRGVSEWDREAFIDLLTRKVRPLTWYITLPRRQPRGLRRFLSPVWRGSSSLDRDIDFLMRFERLQEDFEGVCGMLQIEAPTLPVRNPSSREHYSVYYDDELRELVRSRFAEEIRFGNYRFEEGPA